MKAPKINIILFNILLVLFLFGCATTKAPRGWLPDPDDKQTDVFGCWIVLEYNSNEEEQLAGDLSNKAEQLAGEFIAIDQDSIFIANEKFYAFAHSDIRSAQLEIYNSNSGAMGVLVLLGILSTGSNGFYAAISAPIWLFGGMASTYIRSYEPIIKYPKKETGRTSEDTRFPQDSPPEIKPQEINWDSISQFARFPQGLPPEIARQKIKMKAVKHQENPKMQHQNYRENTFREE